MTKTKVKTFRVMIAPNIRENVWYKTCGGMGIEVKNRCGGSGNSYYQVVEDGEYKGKNIAKRHATVIGASDQADPQWMICSAHKTCELVMSGGCPSGKKHAHNTLCKRHCFYNDPNEGVTCVPFVEEQSEYKTPDVCAYCGKSGISELPGYDGSGLCPDCVVTHTFNLEKPNSVDKKMPDDIKLAGLDLYKRRLHNAYEIIKVENSKINELIMQKQCVQHLLGEINLPEIAKVLESKLKDTASKILPYIKELKQANNDLAKAAIKVPCSDFSEERELRVELNRAKDEINRAHKHIEQQYDEIHRLQALVIALTEVHVNFVKQNTHNSGENYKPKP